MSYPFPARFLGLVTQREAMMNGRIIKRLYLKQPSYKLLIVFIAVWIIVFFADITISGYLIPSGYKTAIMMTIGQIIAWRMAIPVLIFRWVFLSKNHPRIVHLTMNQFLEKGHLLDDAILVTYQQDIPITAIFRDESDAMLMRLSV